MIKVCNNTATREPIPSFLAGLAPESLADLSWTDPALGVSDCAWWPEFDQSPVLGEYERYGDETLTVDTYNQQVIVTRSVVPWTAEEIEADYHANTPQVVDMAQARLALLQAGLLDQVEAAVPGMGKGAQIEWEYRTTVRRDNALVLEVKALLGVDDHKIDELFYLAASL